MSEINTTNNPNSNSDEEVVSGLLPNTGSNEKRVVRYKFGYNEIDLDSYLRNLSHNVQRYLESKNWSEDQKDEFKDMYNTYIQELQSQLESGASNIYTDQFGTIYGSKTLVDTDDYYYDEKNNRIDSNTYNNLSPRKQKKYKKFNASSAVAGFFNWVGREMKAIEAPKPITKKEFDLKTMGFEAYWNKQNNRSGGKPDLSPFINKDPYDPTTKKRGTSVRTAYLKGQLGEYIRHAETYKDYDWSKTSFGTFNEYMDSLRALYDSLGNEWDDTDIINANRAGIDSSFYSPFFSTERNPFLTPEQKQIIAESENKAKEQEKQNVANNQIKSQKEAIITRFRNLNFKYGRVVYHDPIVGHNIIQNGGIQIPNTISEYSDDEIKNINNAKSILQGLSQLLPAVYAGETLDSTQRTQLSLAIRLYELEKKNICEGIDGKQYIEFLINDPANPDLATILYDIQEKTLFVAPKILLTKYSQKLTQTYNDQNKESFYKTGGIIRAQEGIQVNYEDINDVLKKLDEEKTIENTSKKSKTSYDKLRDTSKKKNGQPVINESKNINKIQSWLNNLNAKDSLNVDLDKIAEKTGLRLKKGGNIQKAREGVKVDREEAGNSNFGMKNAWKYKLLQYIDNPTLIFGAPRAIKGKMVNKDIIAGLKDAVKPLHKNAVHKNLKSPTNTLEVENQGKKNMADLIQNSRNNLMTSDSDRNTGVLFESIVKGIEFDNQAKAASNEIKNRDNQFQLQQTQDNILSAHEAQEFNKAQDIQAIGKKAELPASEKSANFGIDSEYSEQNEKQDIAKKNKTAQQEASDLAFDIEDQLKTNIENVAKIFNYKLTPDEIAAWNAIKNGGMDFTDLTPEAQKNFTTAAYIAGVLGRKMRSEATGTPPSLWSSSRRYLEQLAPEII